METYTIAKGDKLEVVARKHGHGDWRTLWKAPENRALVARRRKPEALQPGDRIVIPPTEEQRRDATLEAARRHVARGADLTLQAQLRSEIARLPKVIAMWEGMIAGRIAYAAQTGLRIDKARTDMQTVAERVDAVADVASLLVDLAKIAQICRKASTSSGEALVELNKKARDEVRKLSKAAGGQAAELIALLEERDEVALASIGILADSFDKITSPSFWAHTAVQLKEGRSWSEAVSMDIGEDLEAQKQTLQGVVDKDIRRMRERQAEVRAQLATFQGMLKVVEARLKAYEADTRSP